MGHGDMGQCEGGGGGGGRWAKEEGKARFPPHSPGNVPQPGMVPSPLLAVLPLLALSPITDPHKMSPTLSLTPFNSALSLRLAVSPTPTPCVCPPCWHCPLTPWQRSPS